jgi:hypothetical protein
VIGVQQPAFKAVTRTAAADVGVKRLAGSGGGSGSLSYILPALSPPLSPPDRTTHYYHSIQQLDSSHDNMHHSLTHRLGDRLLCVCDWQQVTSLEHFSRRAEAKKQRWTGGAEKERMKAGDERVKNRWDIRVKFKVRSA